jgi:DNA-binding winged helix-turn-helix (wHTH) protein
MWVLAAQRLQEPLRICKVFWWSRIMRLRFGAFTFDSGTRELLRGDTDVHLSPKSFELLKTLIENRPQAVSKAQLQQHLWPDTFVSEANLPLLLGEVRKALEDDAKHPRFIRTLQRYGYAFCGSVTEISGLETARLHQGVCCWLVLKRKRLDLVEGENFIGRDPHATVYVDAASVSRRHARIILSAAQAMLEDLGSKNGTFVQGKRVTASAHLRDGDPIRFGSVLATFRIGSPDVPTKTARAQ